MISQSSRIDQKIKHRPTRLPRIAKTREKPLPESIHAFSWFVSIIALRAYTPKRSPKRGIVLFCITHRFIQGQQCKDDTGCAWGAVFPFESCLQFRQNC